MLQQLKDWIDHASHAVFFGGAGVSTESGIPDFRGKGGLYTRGDTPEYLLSRTCLLKESEKFFDFYKNHILHPEAKPNGAHIALAQLEKQGKIHAVLTQNIDGLHQRAGSLRVFELHGTTARYRCDACEKVYAEDILRTASVPRCTVCGGMVRPDVVLYGEGLHDTVWHAAVKELLAADLLIVGGSSLVVQPAASLVAGFGGEHLVIINHSPTPYDAQADLVMRESVSSVLSALVS